MHNSHTYTYTEKDPFLLKHDPPRLKACLPEKTWYVVPPPNRSNRLYGSTDGSDELRVYQTSKGSNMSGKKAQLLVEAKKELDQSIHMVKAPAALREDPSLTVSNIKVKVSQQQKEDNRMEE
ncbi:hypothetical protein OROGR_028109 [Orobanche gracilis]